MYAARQKFPPDDLFGCTFEASEDDDVSRDSIWFCFNKTTSNDALGRLKKLLPEVAKGFELGRSTESPPLFVGAIIDIIMPHSAFWI